MLSLDQLGDRIMVLGPSNAGKSTLALALSERLGLPPVHLDQLQHLPNTNWEMRPEAEFKALHDEAILEVCWVMDGNYSRLMPQRIERATSIILLLSNHWLRLGRYLKRSMPGSHRAGTLKGGQDPLKWEMIDWILFKTSGNSARYRRIVKQSGLPFVLCEGIGELKTLYREWGLSQPK
ncbi:AAA family ATPase [Parvularcula sp. ZS-1/3]|uniref:AAA family ATPase n=1 Tax=Parvularcula mediterranea TaxID=2732508 RepID=A0A7Y3RKE8_9PROT|nr:AAA family ATPase [Parvularcula mediterranea]NNU15012.1 AAA family ATPase [Parvularcula mediterranea]